MHDARRVRGGHSLRRLLGDLVDRVERQRPLPDTVF